MDTVDSDVMLVEHGDSESAGKLEGPHSIVMPNVEKFSTKHRTAEEKGEHEEVERVNKVPFFKLFSLADPLDILLMVVGTVGAVGNGSTRPVMTILFGDVIDTFGTTVDNSEITHRISKVSLKFVYLAMGALVAAFLQVACWMVAGERQAGRIRALYLQTILKQDIAFFDKETDTGEIIGRMSGDTVLIQEAMGEKVGKFIQLFISFVGGFVVAMSKGWRLTLVLLSAIPVLVAVASALSVMVAKIASRGQTAYARAASVVEQTIISIRTVASFTGEKQAVENYKKFLVSAYKTGTQEGAIVGFGFGAVLCALFCSFSLGNWYGAKLIINEGYNGGRVINVIVALLTGSMSMGQASPCLSAFAAGQAAAYKMFTTIQREPEIDSSDKRGKTPEDIRGNIELKDVVFSYPTRPNEQILGGFSLVIPNGTTAALIGHSGSGKSTVLSLLERFYDPQGGQILIDGINLKDYQLKWIRTKIGLVSQEPVLFTSSIKENIRCGKEDASDEQIRAAAEIANAAKFIDQLPKGMDTLVGERGTQLSGGQKQRIAIARAILKDPCILLMDEATSALDAESERVVQEALDRVMVYQTTVIVAHRLTTIRNADMIAVIEGGKVVERGSHSELLMSSVGAYSQLIRVQEFSKEDEERQNDDGIHSDSFGKARVGKKPLRRSLSRGSSRDLATGSSFHEKGEDAVQIPSEDDAAEVPLRRLVYLNKPETHFLVAGTLAAAINGTVFPIFGLLLSKVIKVYYEDKHHLRKDSKFWSSMFLILGMAAFVFYPAQTYFFSVAGHRLIRRIRTMCFEKIVHMEMGWFDEPRHSTGAIGSRLSADAATIRGLVGDPAAQMVQNLSSIVAGLVIAFSSSWELSLIVLATIPLIGASVVAQVKFLQGFSADAKTMYEDASQVASDAVGNIRTVASFCAEEKVMKVYEKKCQGPQRSGIKRGLISGFGFGVAFFLLYTVYATCFYAGARLIEKGKTDFTGVFRVFFALAMTARGISQTSALAPDSFKAKGTVASVFAIIDRKSKIDPSDESGSMLDSVKGDIELRHVSFRYPSRPDVQVFGDLSLAIRSGTTVALVGESGSGKSSVVALLQRFYDPDSGSLTLDGVDIQRFQLKWLRQQMGLVSQEPVLFNETIYDNIAYGMGGNATEAEIIAAAELANAHKFISSLQQGYKTVVGERGVQLSGGQKQRIAIARAIIKNPKILLLDEATSALDAEAEKVVQNALERVMVSRTTVVVAHRLSAIKNSDLILVIKDGVVVEQGTHESMINHPTGFYSTLVALHQTVSA